MLYPSELQPRSSTLLYYVARPKRRSPLSCGHETFGGLAGGAGCVVSGCNPGATFPMRNLLKIVGQYSFKRLFAALNPMRTP